MDGGTYPPAAMPRELITFRERLLTSHPGPNKRNPPTPLLEHGTPETPHGFRLQCHTRLRSLRSLPPRLDLAS